MGRNSKVVWITCDPMPPLPLDIRKNKQLTIGRQNTADLQLPHNCVSRNHARIRSISERCLLIEDLGSSNGTFVNGKKITAFPLQTGDIISIGPFDLEIRNQPFHEGNTLGSTNTDFLTTSRSTAMAGQIEKTSLAEVFQNIEFHAKTGTLYVESKDQDGFFVFAAGRPISAQYGELHNISALMAMLCLPKGNFVLTDKLEPIEGAIDATITSILLNFSRIQDESSEENHCLV